MHNLGVMLRQLDYLHALRRSRKEFDMYAGYDKTQVALDVWDAYMENGYAYVKKRESVLGAAFTKGQSTLSEEWGENGNEAEVSTL